jgi:hypothetical protein
VLPSVLRRVVVVSSDGAVAGCARAVVVVGMPYPNVKDPELVARREYLDALRPSGKGSVGGDQYYQDLCMKAVNQSIGVSRAAAAMHACACATAPRVPLVAVQGARFGMRGTTLPLSYWMSGTAARRCVSSCLVGFKAGLMCAPRYQRQSLSWRISSRDTNRTRVTMHTVTTMASTVARYRRPLPSRPHQRLRDETLELAHTHWGRHACQRRRTCPRRTSS